MMAEAKTPLKRIKSLQSRLEIPPSPMMKTIGYGTGVAVYELPRTSSCNRVQSPWAVKKLTERARSNKQLEKRLVAEAELLKQLDHPNIVGFRALANSPNGSTALAMEECKSSLGDLIEGRFETEAGPFPPKLILKVCQDMANALNYLHNEALLMHCDVKSYNVLVKGDFSICKLCDFGVSLPVTKSGELDKGKAGNDAEYLGTNAWGAPEVLDYPQVITTKADIYAYGLIVWEMIVLTPPVDDEVANSLNSSSIAAINDSFDELIESTPVSKKRPSIPDDVELNDNYEFVLEVYYLCTETERKLRPSAQKLVKVFKEYQKASV